MAKIPQSLEVTSCSQVVLFQLVNTVKVVILAGGKFCKNDGKTFHRRQFSR